MMAIISHQPPQTYPNLAVVSAFLKYPNKVLLNQEFDEHP